MKAKLAEWGMLILLLVYIADSVNKIGQLIATRNWWLIAVLLLFRCMIVACLASTYLRWRTPPHVSPRKEA
jgi:hypothetical protein